MKPRTCKAKIERKLAQLPRYVVLPATIPEVWNLTGTTTVAGTLNGIDLGRRGLKAWGDGKRWFFEVPEPVFRKAGVDTGDTVVLLFAPVQDAIPPEVTELLAASREFAEVWSALTSGRQRHCRMGRERQGRGNTSATRTIALGVWRSMRDRRGSSFDLGNGRINLTVDLIAH